MIHRCNLVMQHQNSSKIGGLQSEIASLLLFQPRVSY